MQLCHARCSAPKRNANTCRSCSSHKIAPKTFPPTHPRDHTPLACPTDHSDRDVASTMSTRQCSSTSALSTTSKFCRARQLPQNPHPLLLLHCRRKKHRKRSHNPPRHKPKTAFCKHFFMVPTYQLILLPVSVASGHVGHLTNKSMRAISCLLQKSEK